MPTLSKSFRLPFSLEKVSEILYNLKLYGGYHPLIKSCKLVEGSNDHYQVNEQPFLWLPLKITYAATVLKKDNLITYQLSDIPLHKAEMTFFLTEPEQQLTQVDVRINVKGPIIIANYLLAKIRNAQIETFTNITSS
jgi:hypothetical protein